MRIINNLQNFLYDKSYYIDIYENYFHVYQYQELVSLSDTLIELKLDKFNLVIKGSNLIVNKMDNKEILIKGIILNVEFKYAK